LELLHLKKLDLQDKKVFIRCDFNVPMDEFGNISDDRRIRSAIATINYCLDLDCAVILASHLGRPKGEVVEKYSLSPVARRLQQLLKRHVELAPGVVDDVTLKWHRIYHVMKCFYLRIYVLKQVRQKMMKISHASWLLWQIFM
jgi:phosphoglycerate kinase